METTPPTLDTTILQGLDRDQIRNLLGACEVQAMQPGQVLIEQGSHGRYLYFLASGKLRVFVTEQDGDTRDLAELTAPAVVGEMEFLTGQTRIANVVALETAQAYALPFSRLHALVEAGDASCLRVMFNIAHVLAVRLSSTVGMLEELAESHERRAELDELRRKLFSDWSI